jgi:protein-S-isoprenylcysteine O-methyltransferase Ste14
MVRLGSASILARLLRTGGWLRLGFALLLLVHALFMPAGLFEEGTFMEELVDIVGGAALIFGGLLYVWAISHGSVGERWARSGRRELCTTGPYAYVQHPLWIANLLIGCGMILLLDAYVFVIFLVILAVVYHRLIVPAEEQFLRDYFGESFDQYRRTTPKYLPRLLSKENLFFGRRVRLREVVPVLAIILVVFFFESIESPHNRPYISTLYHWLRF